MKVLILLAITLSLGSCATKQIEDDDYYGDYGYYPNYYEYKKMLNDDDTEDVYEEDDWFYDYYE